MHDAKHIMIRYSGMKIISEEHVFTEAVGPSKPFCKNAHVFRQTFDNRTTKQGRQTREPSLEAQSIHEGPFFFKRWSSWRHVKCLGSGRLPNPGSAVYIFPSEDLEQ